MANYASLKSDIAGVIRTNHNEEITGDLLQEQLFNMVEELGAGYQYMGVAAPTTNPGTLDCRCFYIASAAGTYTYFKNSSNVALVVADGEVVILKYDTAWSKEVTGAATAAQLTQLGQEVGRGIECADTIEDGFFFVDDDLNIGVKIDNDGLHSPTLLEYEIVNS